MLMLMQPAAPYIPLPKQHARLETPHSSTETGKQPHRLTGIPPELLPSILLCHRHVPVKLDGVRHVQPLDLPGVAKIEPVVWLLVLEAVHDALQHWMDMQGG